MTSLQELDQKYIWHPFSPLKGGGDPLPVIKAKDCTLYLEDGSTLIDAISSWWVNPLGHARKEIADAIYKQMLELEHVIFAGFTHKPAIQLAEKLMALTHNNFSKLFFSDNGSTSIEVALKMCIQYFHNTGKPRKKIISFTDAYHGDTFGAMAVGQKGTFFEAFESFTFDVIQIPLPTQNNWDNYKAEFIQTLAKENVAAFIFEPLLLGSGGMQMYDAQLLDEMIGIAQSYGTFCIADEVMTGFGRTGKMFATDYLSTNKPDVICLSKCLTGGFIPLSVTMVNQKLESGFLDQHPSKTFYHGHSYTANPAGCAAAIASLSLIDSETTQENWYRIQMQHRVFAKQLEEFQNIENIRVLGTVLAFDVTSENAGYFSDIKIRLTQVFKAHGVLLRPLGNVVYIMPPYVITIDELQQVYLAIFEALKTLQSS